MSDSEQVILPRNHQGEALEGLCGVLGRGPRAQAHMCCGSGKTFGQAFLAREMIDACEDPDSAVIVCFVPNRTLVQQNARNFRAVFGDSVEMLGVCSEDDLSRGDAEDHISTVETTTSPELISKFLQRKNCPRIIVSTYHSAPTLRNALAQVRGSSFALLLGLFDEAHRTAGDKTEDDLFAFALSDENFPMVKRAFFTATPRITSGKKTQTYSMSNTEVFGPVAYTYSFRRGIADGNVVDYDLWVPIITRAELAEFMKDQGLSGEDRAAVALIALRKVMERTGQSRFLCYRQRVAASKSFAKDLAQVFPLSFVGHVDGTTPGREREEMMRALSSGDTLLTNCKAFVEGVDSPGLQGVVFVDTRKSVVDVVQAVGRLSRPDKDDPNKRGSIVAPILADSADPEALERAAKSAGFEILVQVAQALRANDDALEEDILTRSRAEGRGDADISTLRGLEVIAPEGSSVAVDDLAQSITVMAMQYLRDDFATQVGRLERFILDHGYLPSRHDDPKLATWISNVRKKHLLRTLDPVHASLLDDVDEWTWVGERTAADKIAEHICAFRDRNQKMPSLKRGFGAEADLHGHLMEAQESFLRYGARSSPLTTAMYERNILFFAEEVLGKRAQISGRFRIIGIGPSAEIWFYPRLDPNRKTIPVFRSGHTVPPRPFKIHAGRGERERLTALGSQHSVRVTLVRAGVDEDPFQDARVLGWHAGSVERGETPQTSKSSFAWLLARLADRKVSGRPAYTVGNLRAKQIKETQIATSLNTRAPQGTVGEVIALLARVRTAGLSDQLDADRMAQLSGAPGFSWVDAAIADEEAVASCVKLIAGMSGVAAFSDKAARNGDNGVANTLRAIDALFDANAELFVNADQAVVNALQLRHRVS